VGDFYEHFSNQGFFDSLVGRLFHTFVKIFLKLMFLSKGVYLNYLPGGMILGIHFSICL
jgi:hypothetical protein